MNIGFLVDGVGNSDLSYYLLKLINEKLLGNNVYSPVIFYKVLQPPVVNPLCLMLNVSSVNDFKGIAIATDLQTADTISKSHSVASKWLYLWDLDWLTEVVNYDSAVELMQQFNIICRSPSHQSLIKNFCGKEATIVENFDWDQLKTCLNLK